MSRRERTGYYDRTGKAICDGDRIKAIIGGQIYTGYVEEFNGDYILTDFDTDAGKVEFFKGEFRVCGEILSNIVYDCEVEIVD